MQRLIAIVLVVSSMVRCAPVEEVLTPEDVFYRSLEPEGKLIRAVSLSRSLYYIYVLSTSIYIPAFSRLEQKALMQMGIEGAVMERGIETMDIKLTVPEVLRQHITVSKLNVVVKYYTL